jgi:S-ribosylhomocysteine lyase
MERIASFSVDHTKFGVGLYLSRVDGVVRTYDVRMCKPNGGKYLGNAAAHTIEHLFATFARNSKISQKVVYVGPMGCMTGFYLLLTGNSDEEVIELVRESLEYISGFSGEIPGNSIEECGNYLFHDLEGARETVLPLLKILGDYKPENLVYPQ